MTKHYLAILTAVAFWGVSYIVTGVWGSSAAVRAAS